MTTKHILLISDYSEIRDVHTAESVPFTMLRGANPELAAKYGLFVLNLVRMFIWKVLMILKKSLKLVM